MLSGKPGTAAVSSSQANPGYTYCFGKWCQRDEEILSMQSGDKKSLVLSQRMEGRVTCNQEINLAFVTRMACARAARGYEDTGGIKHN